MTSLASDLQTRSRIKLPTNLLVSLLFLRGKERRMEKRKLRMEEKKCGVGSSVHVYDYTGTNVAECIALYHVSLSRSVYV